MGESRDGTEQKPPTSQGHKKLHHRRCAVAPGFSFAMITRLLFALEKFQRQKLMKRKQHGRQASWLKF